MMRKEIGKKKKRLGNPIAIYLQNKTLNQNPNHPLEKHKIVLEFGC
jgi:hypothetical protein